MTGVGASPAQEVRRTGAEVPAPRQLWWVYLLIALALAVMGGGAAQALFVTRDLGQVAGTMKCLAEHHVSLKDTPLRDIPRFNRCVASYNRHAGIAIIIGSVLAPALAWILMLCGGLLTRWRLGGVQEGPATEAHGRFETWCDTWNLTGRRRPRLLLVSSGHAFTTGLPLARPWIVVPLSYTCLEPSRFEVVVLHELAHVRSRDLLWSSAVWWAGWLNVPMLLLTAGTALRRPGSLRDQYSGSLWLAAILTVTVLLLRSALLRRRELAADRFALDVLADPGALCGMFAQERKRHPVLALVRRLTASHPDSATRMSTGPTTQDRWEGGFAMTVAATATAMFVFQNVDLVLTDLGGSTWDDPQLALELSFAAASLLWAAVIVPAWARRKASASWRGPLAGMLLGLLAGYYLRIPGASVAVGGKPFEGHLSLLLLALVVVVGGAGTLTTALAVSVAAATGRSRTVAMTAAILTAFVALTAALETTIIVVTGHSLYGSVADDRSMLNSPGVSRFWLGLTPFFLLAGLAVVAEATDRTAALAAVRLLFHRQVLRVPSVRNWTVIAVGAAVGGLCAIVSWQARIGPTLTGDPLYVVYSQRSWICALAGAVVTVVILLTKESAPAPVQAGAAGLLTSMLAGLILYDGAAAAGYGHSLPVIWDCVQMSAWLLFVMMLVCLPLLHLWAWLLPRVRLPAHPLVRRRSAILVTGIAVVLLSAALVGGMLQRVTVAPGDFDTENRLFNPLDHKMHPPQPSPVPVVPTPNPRPADDPTRPLDGTAAHRALTGLEPLLPPEAKLHQEHRGPSSLAKIRPARCGELFDQADSAERKLPRSGDATLTYTFPAPAAAEDVVSLDLSVTSYVTVMPNPFGPLRQQIAQCPHFALPNTGGPITGALTAGEPPKLGYPSFHEDIVFTGLAAVNSINFMTFSAVDEALVGHNLVSVSTRYHYQISPPPATLDPYLSKLRTKIISALLANLR